MLKLTRKIGTQINIGGNIEVHLLSRKGNHITVGIKAPDEIPITRSESHGTREHLTRQPKSA